MAKRYWLHRISHEWEISYPLLEEGLLSIGWPSLMGIDLLGQIQRQGKAAFEKATAGWSQSRWGFWNFSQFRPGDVAVAPLYHSEFAILELTGLPFEITALAGRQFRDKNGLLITVRPDGLWDEQGKFCQIGFAVPVRPLRPWPMPRSLADAPLRSRMKMRQTNGDISDLAASVERALAAKGPASFRETALKAAAPGLRQAIEERPDPDGLEELLCRYMKKQGASRAWRPAKNEGGKEEGADADVVAEFEDLGIVFYIQVKKHRGETGDWAVRQVARYREQKGRNEDYAYISWAVSTADFSRDAVLAAKDEGVRLIGGQELARMLLNCGMEPFDLSL